MIYRLRKEIITGNMWMDILSWKEVIFKIYEVNGSTLFLVCRLAFKIHHCSKHNEMF